MSHTRRIAAQVIFMLAAPCLGQPALDPAKLSSLKRGTVYLHDPGRGQSGSGFVVAVQGDQVYCATNAHVVVSGRTPVANLEAVVESGTPSARQARAKIVAFEENDDLAIVSFTMSKPPAALPFSAGGDALETTPVFVLGFPFGENLAARGKTPTVTVSRASVSAQRRDADGFIEVLQLDGELNPGNSGGPIVGADGKVLGVSVAKVGGTNISFGVPIRSVQAILQGRVKNINLREVPGDRGKPEFSVEVSVLDPLDQVASVSLLTASSDKQKGDPGKPGEFKSLIGAQEHKLTLEEGMARGRVKLKRPGTGKPDDMFQTKLTVKSGKTTYTMPGEFPEAVGEEIQAAGGPREVAQAPEDPKSPSGEREAAEEFAERPAPLDGEKVVKLPSEVEDVKVAGGGQFLVMKLHDVPSLAVVDIFKGEVAKHIRMPSTDFLYAAGGNTILVYLPGDNVLQAFDLKTFERRKSKPNPFGPVITSMVMGYGRGGRALVRSAAGKDELSQASMSLLDTTRLEPIKLVTGNDRRAIPSHNMSYRDAVHFRANRDLGMVSEWATSHSPSGVGVLVRRGNTYEGRYEHNSEGYLSVGDDNRLYCYSGRIYSGKLESVGQLEGQKLIPGLGGSLYLGISREGKISIYEAGKTAPLGSLGDFPDWKAERETYYKQGDIHFDQRVVFMPIHGRIAFIPYDNSSVVVRNFDLKQALDASNVDYLVIRSTVPGPARVGREWSYQIDAISRAGSLTYSLELGPDGMKVSDQGMVRWTPKKGMADEGETIIILVKDGSGEQTYHKFFLPVAGD